MKKNVAVLMGGFSSEKEISLKSGEVIYQNINRSKYTPFKIVVNKEKWIYLNTLKKVNDIEKLINYGYRYIYLNKRVEVIYNYFNSTDNGTISQIITEKGLYGVNFNHFTYNPYSKHYLIFPNGRDCESCQTKILVDAPYQFKRNGIIR